ncbi:MAG: SAVED domain-containing protein [Planctomycetes bacterium]|nr:SAVED domain-containing protein [Planctomycetota bacterium]
MARPAKTKNTPQKASKSTTLAGSPGEPSEVTRYISPIVTAMLWGKAGGRCEFAGCNQPLWRSPVTQEVVNIAERAHIYSFSSGGPRGNAGIVADELNGIDNLLLVCPICHLKIDRAPAGGRYTIPVLHAMKARHELRIEVVTGIDPDLRSAVVLYGANIGDHNSPRLTMDAATAMFPSRYPASATPISLGTLDNPTKDRSDEFWLTEAAHLRNHFERRVRDRLALREIEHLSVFALAPQPLLVLLGTLLGDITPADVYQRQREPQTWSWPTTASTPDLIVNAPPKTDGPPALVLALSATVTRDRIEAMLGVSVSIWEITVPTPHNDLTKSREQLRRFRATLRTVLDRIKASHGQTTPVHVFPVVSAAMAVELGRVRMPMADTPWHVYDQVNDRGGFIRALSIPNGVRS